MKTIIVVLMLLAFIQSSIWPLNFGLMVILTRAFIRQDSSNLFLAFGFGLLISHLQNLSLGIISLWFVLFVEVINLFSKTTLSQNFWSMFLCLSIILILFETITGNFNWSKVILEIILIGPIYLIVRFCEERFIVKPQIKLKV